VLHDGRLIAFPDVNAAYDYYQTTLMPKPDEIER
jgi:hypothetical protein